MTDPVLFALDGSQAFGARVAASLGVPLGDVEERAFEDGEHKARPLVNVRGRDVYVLHALYGDAQHGPDDKLCRLLFFLGAVRDAAAASVTAVVPYLAYARKDARTQPRDPVTTRYVAALFEAMRVDGVVTLDVHNLAAFQNAFRCPTAHLDTTGLFAAHAVAALEPGVPVCVVSPDPGGFKRAERLRRRLAHLTGRDVALALMEKSRGGGVLTTGRLCGDVAGARVLVVDDLVATGATLIHAARTCRAQGARSVVAYAAHGLFVGDAARVLADAALERLVVTDTVPPFRLPPALVQDKIAVVSVTELFGKAIRRLHGGGSLAELLGD